MRVLSSAISAIVIGCGCQEAVDSSGRNHPEVVKLSMACNFGYEWCKDNPSVYLDGKKDYCIFHSPIGFKYKTGTSKKLSNEEFNQLVFDEIERQKAEVGKCELSGTVFPGDISFNGYGVENPLPEISFANTKFFGVTDFGKTKFIDDASFKGAEFSNAAYFSPSPHIWTIGLASRIKFNFHGPKFGGVADFSQSQFNTGTSFYSVTFGGKAAFNGAKFSGDTDFTESEFIGKTNFQASEFTGTANFKETKFLGKSTSFIYATFKRMARFNGVTFKYFANFSSVKFFDEADFKYAKFNGRVMFFYSQFNRASFSGLTFKKGIQIDFSDLIIKDNVAFNGVQMSKPSFLGTDLNKCEFISCQWDEKEGRNILHDETQVINNEKAIIDKIDSTLNRLKVRHFYPMATSEKRQVQNLYRKMKQKYRLSNDEFEASKWHASEKEMQRKGISIKSFDWFLLNLYRFSSGYGENPTRAIKILAYLIIATIIALGSVGLIPKMESDERQDSIIKTVYLIDMSPPYKLNLKKVGIISLTTLEYITFQKTTHYVLKPAGPLGTFIKIICLLLVYSQFTLFVFALRNRFRR
jgi:uncharacterized protein YjbI with pentapeptide repeats